MKDNNAIICSNCGKQLKWIPKGKLTCSCGQVIKTDGKDLRQLEFKPSKFILKNHLPGFVDVLLVSAILLIPLSIYIRVRYATEMLEAEYNFVSNYFGIDPDFHDILKLITGGIIFFIWFFRRIKKRKYK